MNIQAKELSLKLLRHLQLGLVVTSILLSSACTADKNGAGSPDRVVDQYLLALENKDESLLVQLLPHGSSIAGKIKVKIDKFGGYKIQDRQIVYNKPKPVLWNAEIRGFYVDRAGMRQQFNDSIAIGYENKGQVKLYGGRWYLLLD
jgi:hypothetical protein